jgi:hypothetical protein
MTTLPTGDTGHDDQAYRGFLGELTTQRQQLAAWSKTAAPTIAAGLTDVVESLAALAAVVEQIAAARAAAGKVHAALTAEAARIGQPAPPPVADPFAAAAHRIGDVNARRLFLAYVRGWRLADLDDKGV